MHYVSSEDFYSHLTFHEIRYMKCLLSKHSSPYLIPSFPDISFFFMLIPHVHITLILISFLLLQLVSSINQSEREHINFSTSSSFSYMIAQDTLLLTNPWSKSRSHLRFSLKSDLPTTPQPHPPPSKYQISKKEFYNQNKSCQSTLIEFKYVFNPI